MKPYLPVFDFQILNNDFFKTLHIPISYNFQYESLTTYFVSFVIERGHVCPNGQKLLD